MQREAAFDRDVEQALRQSEARLLNVLMHLPDGVIINSGNRISFVNDAAKRLFGADEPELLGRVAQEVLPRGSLAADRARLAALQAVTLPVPTIEEQIVRADGSSRTVETSTILIEDHGEVSILAIMRDITDLKTTQNNLLEAHADLQHLLSERDSVQEEERKRIARELHDDLQQTLAAIRIDLSVAAERLAADPAGTAALLERIDRLAVTAISSTRRIVNDLRPQVLAERDLVPALGLLAGQFTDRTGIACRFEPGDEAVEALLVSPAATMCLYRVAQEALNNVVKHAGASAVHIDLASPQDGELVLRVSDNGRGMEAAESRCPGAFGLLGMRERVRAVGGTLRIDSNPGAGTTVEVHVAFGRDGPAPARPEPAAREPGSQRMEVATPQRPVVSAGVAEDRPATAAVPGAEATALQGVIDAFPAHTAVIDARGRITLVNRAWRDFAEQNGDPGMNACGPGVDYLDTCRRSALTDRSAQQVLEGLRGVLDGSRAAFVSEYPCDAPHEPRWFRLQAAPIVGGGALVTHFRLGAGDPPGQGRIERP